MLHRVAALFVGLLFLAAYSARPAHGGQPPRYVLRDTTYHLVSDFGADSLLLREVQFEDPIVDADVDSASGILLLFFPPRESEQRFVNDVSHKRLVAYDLSSRRVVWTDRREGDALTTLDHRALLFHGSSADLIQLKDGEKIGGLRAQTFLWTDGLFLGVTGGTITKWKLDDGSEVWSRERETGGSASEVIRRDSVAYLFAEGVQRIDLRDGSGWSYSMKANRGGLYGSLGGETMHVRSLYGGTRAVDLTASPLITGRDVFFAADTTVVRLDARTGAVRWQRQLHRPHGFSLRERALGIRSQEFLGHLLVRDAFSKIAVASLGWASGAKNTWLRADPPTLALFAKDDGQPMERIQLPGLEFLNDVRSTSHGHYAIGRDRVLAMDDHLAVRATFRAPQEIQPLGAFLDVGGLIVVTTGAGIAALSPDSLQLVWSQRCGRMLAIERDLDWSGARYFVTTQGVLRLEQGTGKRSTDYYPLRASWARFAYEGVVMGFGDTLWLVALPERGGVRRID